VITITSFWKRERNNIFLSPLEVSSFLSTSSLLKGRVEIIPVNVIKKFSQKPSNINRSFGLLENKGHPGKPDNKKVPSKRRWFQKILDQRCPGKRSSSQTRL
jgi:hypothetical protein